MFYIIFIILHELFFQFSAQEQIIQTVNLYQNNKIRNLNSNNVKKNVIIGLVKGYYWRNIRPFFISYLKAGFKNCELVMFVDKLSEETINKMKLCGATVRDIPVKHLGFRKLMKYRWKWYADFLSENKEKYNEVFSADIRDTIFQKDIFQLYDNNKPFISFFLEESNLRDPVNKYWVKSLCKTKEEYNSIAEKQIICGGTILASVDIFIDFSNILYDTISNYETTSNKEIYDQGAVNYLVYYKKLYNDIMILKNNSGPVITLCLVKRNKIKLDSENNVLNYEGNIAAVVHQYDRKPDINLKMFQKYNDDILEKYLSIKKFHEQENKIEQKSIKIKILKKVILFIFIIFSLSIICFYRAKRNGFCKETQTIQNLRKAKIKDAKNKRKKDKNDNNNINKIKHDLNTSEFINIMSKKPYFKKKKYK